MRLYEKLLPEVKEYLLWSNLNTEDAIRMQAISKWHKESSRTRLDTFGFKCGHCDRAISWDWEVELEKEFYIAKSNMLCGLIKRHKATCLPFGWEQATLGQREAIERFSCRYCGTYLAFINIPATTSKTKTSKKLRLPRLLVISSPRGRTDRLCQQDIISIRCTGIGGTLRENQISCGTVFCTGRSVLSFKHTWDAGRGTERAWFIDTIHNVSIAEPSARMLAQGPIDVADIYCLSCRAQVGWKFCQDFQLGEPNAHQIGRFGLVESSIDMLRMTESSSHSTSPSFWYHNEPMDEDDSASVPTVATTSKNNHNQEEDGEVENADVLTSNHRRFDLPPQCYW